jgi:hypothetical protein
MNPPVALQHKGMPALYVIAEAQAGKGEQPVLRLAARRIRKSIPG